MSHLNLASRFRRFVTEAAKAAPHYGEGLDRAIVSDALIASVWDETPAQSRSYRVLGVKIDAWGFASVYDDQLALPAVTELVGRSAAELVSAHVSLAAAALDAVAAALPPGVTSSPDHVVHLSRLSSQKKVTRHRIIVDLISDLQGQSETFRVVSLGYFPSLIFAARERGIELSWLDASLGAASSPDLKIKDFDCVLMSGSSLCDGSIDRTIADIEWRRQEVIMIAQTGAMLIPHLLRNLDCTIVSEPFPFWYLDGPSELRLFRRSPGRTR